MVEAERSPQRMLIGIARRYRDRGDWVDAFLAYRAARQIDSQSELGRAAFYEWLQMAKNQTAGREILKWADARK